MSTLFVSHSHHDDAFGQRLVTDLRAHLGEDAVWYDASGGLHGGDEWWIRTVAEITARDIFLVILSPAALASDWVPREMGVAYWRHVKLGKRLLPLLYRPCALPTDWQLIHALGFRDDDAVTYMRSLDALFREIRGVGVMIPRQDPPLSASTSTTIAPPASVDFAQLGVVAAPMPDVPAAPFSTSPADARARLVARLIQDRCVCFETKLVI